MLRGAVSVIGVLGLLLCGLGFLHGAGAAMIAPGIISALFVVAPFIERFRYRRLETTPPAGTEWRRTGEKFFVDPDEKTTVEVWFNAATGARRYVKLD